METDRLDLKCQNSRATTYRIEPEKTGRKSLEVGGETLQYYTEHHQIGYYGFLGQAPQPETAPDGRTGLEKLRIIRLPYHMHYNS